MIRPTHSDCKSCWINQDLQSRVGLQARKSELRRKDGRAFDGEDIAFLISLRDCTKSRDLSKGTQLHEDILRKGLLEQCSDALVTMYAKCGALEKAEELLCSHNSKDVISWTSLVAGYARQGRSKEALDCLDWMQRKGLSPNAVTFTCALKACGALGATAKGKEIHDEIARQGLLQNDVVLGTALADMYAKCGALGKAQRILEELPSQDVVSWSALIAAYAQNSQGEQALDCFRSMQQEGIPPNAVTLACTLKACATMVAIDKGEQIHDQIVRQGLLGKDIVLDNALVDMYAKCGALSKAHQLLEELPFRNVFLWTALIAGYAQQGHSEHAFSCFEQMYSDGIHPNEVTFACILKACAAIGAVDKGTQIHEEINRQGLLKESRVLGNALVDMYVKCGSLVTAQRLLEELPSFNIVSWNTLLAEYVRQGQGEQALACFERMQRERIPSDEVTFTCILKACGILGTTDKGEEVHEEIARQGLLGSNNVVGTALVDMYAKCGALARAQAALEENPSRDIASWNSLIAGFAQQGQAEQAFNCFNRMQLEGIFPNAATFSCMLSVCNHLGLVDDGHMYFVDMTTKFGIRPDLELYTTMIDLFGRTGPPERAIRLIQEMPSSDCRSPIWHALLGACQKWGDAIIGRWAFEQAIQLNKADGAAYVLMANIYAAASMQEELRVI